MQQRLQLVTPALTEVRRRLKDVESSLEAVQTQVAGERQHSERLERETTVCQEKMRALRDENVRLAERCAELEAKLPQQRTAPTALRRSLALHANIGGSTCVAPSRSQALESHGKAAASRARSGPPSQPLGHAAAASSASR